MQERQIITGIEALDQVRHNPFRMFGFKESNDNTAHARITVGDFCAINHPAKFPLKNSDCFFTMGSCFAREIELAILELGMSLTAVDQTFPYEWFNPNHARLPDNAEEDGGLLTRQRSPINRYSVKSMLYDFERVLENTHSFDETVIRLVDDLKVWDPQIKNLQRSNLEFAETARAVLDNIIASVTEADVVILTLGMTETWKDNESGAVLPTPPNLQLLKRFPQRFSFFNASYENVIADLNGIIDIIAKHCSKSPKIVFTVSPVPMGMTFTKKDVIVANSYSKSTLVSAAQTISDQYDHVDYFPSYDMVMNSSRSIWHDDLIHIREEYVALIMQQFVASYIR